MKYIYTSLLALLSLFSADAAAISLQFKFTDGAYADCIKNIRNWSSSSFLYPADAFDSQSSLTVESGTDLQLNFNVPDWTVNSVSYAGSPLELKGSSTSKYVRFTANVSGEIVIDAAKKEYAQLPVTATVIGANGLLFYGGSIADDHLLKLPAGSPAAAFSLDGVEFPAGAATDYRLTVSEKQPWLTIAAKDGWWIKTTGYATPDGIEVANLNSFQLSESDHVYIIAKKVVADSKAVVYVEDNTTFELRDDKFNTLALQPGYNFIEFDAEYSNPFRLYDKTANQTSTATHNGEAVKRDPENGNLMPQTLADASVLKIFRSAAPDIEVSFDIAEGRHLLLKYDHIVDYTDFSTPLKVKRGTLLHLSVNDSDNLLINDTPADSPAQFTVTAPTVVKVSPTQGIVSAAADSEYPAADLFNLQGVAVGNSLEALPSGIYIQKGKKIRK